MTLMDLKYKTLTFFVLIVGISSGFLEEFDDYLMAKIAYKNAH